MAVPKDVQPPGPEGWHSTASDPRKLLVSRPSCRGRSQAAAPPAFPTMPTSPASSHCCLPRKLRHGWPGVRGVGGEAPPLRGPPGGWPLPGSSEQGPRRGGWEQEPSCPGCEALGGGGQGSAACDRAAHGRVGEADVVTSRESTEGRAGGRRLCVIEGPQRRRLGGGPSLEKGLLTPHREGGDARLPRAPSAPRGAGAMFCGETPAPPPVPSS